MTASTKTVNRPLKDMKGFTFIELMVVIAMMSVLSTIAVFN